jgi:hypothetical protein
MRYKKTQFDMILKETWPANRRALEKKLLIASELAHGSKDPQARASFFSIKHKILCGMFDAAYRPNYVVTGKPRIDVHRRMVYQNCRVFSIRLRKGVALHLPEVHASPLIVQLVDQKISRSFRLEAQC